MANGFENVVQHQVGSGNQGAFRVRRVMDKIGGPESDNVINMVKVRLHASRTHLSLPKMRRDNQMAADKNQSIMFTKRNKTSPEAITNEHMCFVDKCDN
jgi:hypothetical protein